MSSKSLFLAIALTTAVAACSTTKPVANDFDAAQVVAPAHQVDVPLPAWRVPDTANIAAPERLRLQTLLQAELTNALAHASRDIVVDATITRVEAVSPGLNVASALVLFLPFDGGGATVELACRDARTGATLAVFTSVEDPSMKHLRARFHRLGPAELALREAAAKFAAQVQLAIAN